MAQGSKPTAIRCDICSRVLQTYRPASVPGGDDTVECDDWCNYMKPLECFPSPLTVKQTIGLADVEAAITALPMWLEKHYWKGPTVNVDQWLVVGHSNGGQSLIAILAGKTNKSNGKEPGTRLRIIQTSQLELHLHRVTHPYKVSSSFSLRSVLDISVTENGFRVRTVHFLE